MLGFNSRRTAYARLGSQAGRWIRQPRRGLGVTVTITICLSLIGTISIAGRFRIGNGHSRAGLKFNGIIERQQFELRWVWPIRPGAEAARPPHGPGALMVSSFPTRASPAAIASLN